MQYTAVQKQSYDPSITPPRRHRLELSEVRQCVIIKLNLCIENYNILNYKNYKSIKHLVVTITYTNVVINHVNIWEM
jgi:hypothetical protein